MSMRRAHIPILCIRSYKSDDFLPYLKYTFVQITLKVVFYFIRNAFMERLIELRARKKTYKVPVIMKNLSMKFIILSYLISTKSPSSTIGYSVV